MKKTWLILLIILLNISAVWANNLNIVVVGLINDQVILEINENRYVLKIGESSPEGVIFISSYSRGVVLHAGGMQKKYRLGRHVDVDYVAPSAQPILTLLPTNGMYITPGSINGVEVGFIIDTGASAVAINAATAKRLGLDYLKAKTGKAKTASGEETVYLVTLDQVQVGDIKLTNVGAMVFDSEQPERALLGMTFLSQLEIQHNGDQMELKQKQKQKR